MGKKQGRNLRELQPNQNSTSAGAVYVTDLLTPAAYFARYGELLSQTSTTYEAWLETEKEFNRTYSRGDVVLRRFLNFKSFCNALTLHQSGGKVSYMKIHTLYL